MFAAALVCLVGTAVIAGALYRALRQRRAASHLKIALPAGIDEEGFVRLGAIDQWVSIRGEDRANPVLLLLHGGPGMSYSLLTPLLRAWEEHFTVVQWDQRGAGKTFGRNGKRGSGDMTFARLTDDGIELVEHLRSRLGHERVVLLSSSMGTLVGLPMVKRRPDLFSAYVGTDLNTGMTDRAYRRTLERLRAIGETRAAAALEGIGADGSRWDVRAWNLMARSTGKTVEVGPRLEELFFPRALLAPRHSLRDLVHLIAGVGFSTTRLFRQFMSFDARRLGARFEVPFFVFQGEADPFTLTELAEEYFRSVDAPTKHFALIRGAGHLAAFTRPEEFLAELLAHVRPLAAAVEDRSLSRRSG